MLVALCIGLLNAAPDAPIAVSQPSVAGLKVRLAEADDARIGKGWLAMPIATGAVGVATAILGVFDYMLTFSAYALLRTTSQPDYSAPTTMMLVGLGLIGAGAVGAIILAYQRSQREERFEAVEDQLRQTRLRERISETAPAAPDSL